MIALYLTEPGSVLRREGDSFVVTFDRDPDGSGPMPETRKILLEIEPHRVSWIALLSGVHITHAATKLALWKGIPIAWLTHSGRFLGRLSPAREGGVEARIKQYNVANNTEESLEIAKSIVEGKLSNAAALLRYMQSNRPGTSEIATAYQDIIGAIPKAKASQNLNELRGWEGASAKAFYSLLSFCYVLLAARLSGMIQARGLDPALGFLHGIRPGRESLVYDLMEEFRHPIVDRFVLRICNLRIVNPNGFEADPHREGAVLMSDPTRRRLLAEWEKHLRQPLRSGNNTPSALAVMARQVDQFASALSHEKSYEPFLTSSDDGTVEVEPTRQPVEIVLDDDDDIEF
jgi:CRISP-associated protein Cas1